MSPAADVLPAPDEAANAVGPYEPRAFWESRLRSRFNLDGVGFRGLGLPFNGALYRQREVVLGRALRRYGIDPGGADVLELGPGTGFYVRIWHALGARSVTGLDVTEVVCERLRERFPGDRFERADITDPWPVAAASADLVTAFDVVFHVVDDDGFGRVIQSAAAALRPGGHFLVTDLFPHDRAIGGYHQRSRTLAEYGAALDAAGFDVLGRLPVFVTMHPPFDVPPGWRRSVGWRWWRGLEAWLRGHRASGRWIGAVLRWVDRGATLLVRDGPSTELMVARRR